ncbi:MAG: NAD(+)/NADH kinase [Planctomycetaceae bacterium]|nr:NAD(+)/NADH kinase [Planctomycetaceae bacterium]
MRVILLGNAERQGVLEAVVRLRPKIAKYCTIVAEEFRCEQDLERVEADLAIVFGGDGSILRAAAQMRNRQRPVISVNLGTLGFLATFTPEMLIPTLRDYDVLSLPREEYLMLTCQLWRGEQLVVEKTALNEVAVQSGPPYRVLEVELSVDDERITTYRCDGLILSTPIGSTARILSAGGPILRSDLDAVVISPISAHTLSHRPVVDSANRIYRLLLRSANAPVMLDGQAVATTESGDRIVVQRAPERFKMIKLPGFSYYRTLREKLGWGGRLESVDKNRGKG